MKVKIEFDTRKTVASTKVYHDGVLQTDIQNIILILDPAYLPGYCFNSPQFFVDIFTKGLGKAVEDAKR